MFANDIRKQISQHVQDEFKTFDEIQSETEHLFVDTCKLIRKNSVLATSELGDALLKFAANSIELGRSIRESLSNGRIVAACGLCRWHLVLSQKIFHIHNSKDAFELWKSGKNPSDATMRNFIKKLGGSKRKPKYDYDESTYRLLSDMVHWTNDGLEQLFRYATAEQLSEPLKFDIKELQLYNLKYTARTLYTVVCFYCDNVDSQSATRQDIKLRWEEVSEKLLKLKDAMTNEKDILLDKYGSDS